MSTGNRLPWAVIRRFLIFSLLLCFCNTLPADEFTVEDIRIQGLRKVDLGVVLTALPVRIGERFDEADTPRLIGALYQTDLFEDVRVLRYGGILHIRVIERPGIAAITFSGNKEAPDEQLIEALKLGGISVGGVFDRAVIDRLQEEMLQQYFAIGKYNTQVDIEVTELDNRRVEILVRIEESDVVKIRSVRLSGNSAVSDDEIYDVIESAPRDWYEFWSSSDEYSRLKLAADLEAIGDLYFNRGYLDFNIEDTQVALDPENEAIYIDIRIYEGQQYYVDRIRIGGDAQIFQYELRDFVRLSRGDVFSRAAMVRSGKVMEGLLKKEGYAFATVNVIPEPKRNESRVDVNFIAKTGKKTYVRRINIRGNSGTADEVFRRELRQMESAPYASDKIELSKRRIQRLPYVSVAEIKNLPVEGLDNQIDLDISVAERLAGSFNIGAGISDEQGLVFSFRLNQENFLGSGNRVGLIFNNSDAQTDYGFNFFDPYYTADGVSRHIGVRYRSTDYDDADIDDADSDEIRLSLNFGLPITENDVLGLGVSLQSISLSDTSSTNTRLARFIEREGRDFFNPLILSAGISYDTRDRSLFPTEGTRINANATLFTPGINDLGYLKLDYSHQRYIPLDENKDYIFMLRGRASYVKALGDTKEVPFYDKFYVGGSRSVRGYRANTIGPKEADGDPLGGDSRLIANAELYLPTDWLYDPQRLRVAAFVDAGNVYEKHRVSVSDIRVGYGLQFQWLSAVGGITFNVARQLNDESDDRTESFQFDLGSSF